MKNPGRSRLSASVRRACLAFALIASASGCALASEADYGADFDHLWSTLDREYAYFDGRVDWAAVRDVHRPNAVAAKSRDEFIGALERTLETLGDSHLHLRTNTPHSTRLVPSGLDVWAEWRGSRAVVTQVRAGHAAEAAGIRAGDEILTLGGRAIAARVDERMPCCQRTDRAATRDWVLREELAGTHDADRMIGLRRRDGSHYDVRLAADFRPAPEKNVSWRRLDGNLGYLRVTAVGDPATVAAFDAALEALRDTRGLVLDLSETAAGGSTDVAEPILGRFFARAAVYQAGRPRVGEPWRRSVAPRGPWTYSAPLVVLVSRWTGSMGEGMAIGLDGTRRATVVGTRMAGLRGAVFTGELPRTGIGFTYPAERLFAVDGTPRERFRPRHEVRIEGIEPAKQPGAILEAGVVVLRRLASDPRADVAPKQRTFSRTG